MNILRHRYLDEATEGGEGSTGEGLQEQSAVAAEVATEETAPAWNLAENVAGDGDAPEWFKGDKYTSVSEQAKAYVELEGRFGSFTGAPEDYELHLSDSLKEEGVSIDADDPMLQEAMKFAKDSNMSQDGFTEMVNMYGLIKVAENNAMALNRDDEIKALGNNAQARISNLNDWGRANLSEDLLQGFTEMTATAASVAALEHMIGLTKGAPLSPEGLNPASAVSEDEVKGMQFAKDEYGNRRIQTDPAFKAEYEKKRNALYGAGEHRVVIG